MERGLAAIQNLIALKALHQEDFTLLDNLIDR
jgi:hypothetical protein